MARAWPLSEGAIVADIPTKMRERNEHLARIRKVAPMPLVAQTTRGVDRLRERRVLKPDRKRLVARIAHSPTFEAVSCASTLCLARGRQMMWYLYRRCKGSIWLDADQNGAVRDEVFTLI